MTCWRETDDGVELSVRAQPAGPANRIQGVVTDADGTERLKIQITAPPEDGKANAAIVKLLAKALKRPKSALTLTAGATARNKTFLIAGASAADIRVLIP